MPRTKCLSAVHADIWFPPRLHVSSPYCLCPVMSLKLSRILSAQLTIPGARAARINVELALRVVPPPWLESIVQSNSPKRVAKSEQIVT